MKEWLKFAVALIVCVVLLILIFALALYCGVRSEGETTILPLLTAESTPLLDQVERLTLQ